MKEIDTVVEYFEKIVNKNNQIDIEGELYSCTKLKKSKTYLQAIYSN